MTDCREKEQQGIPDLPGGGRYVELEFAAIGDRKLRSQLRNIFNLERQARLFCV